MNLNLINDLMNKELFNQTDSFSNDVLRFEKNIFISTTPEVLIINGRPFQKPGKTGQIKLVILFSDCQELIEEEKLVGVHGHAYFKDFCFLQEHNIVPDDENGILFGLNNFLKFFK